MLKTGQIEGYTYNSNDVFTWDMYDVLNSYIKFNNSAIGTEVSPYVYVNDQAEAYWFRIEPGSLHEDLDQYHISFTSDFNHSYNRGEYLLTITRHNGGSAGNNQICVTLNNLGSVLFTNDTHGLACAVDTDGYVYFQCNAAWSSLLNIKRVRHNGSLDADPVEAGTYRRVASAPFGTIAGFTSLKTIYDSGTIVYNCANKNIASDAGRTTLNAQALIEDGVPLANKYLTQSAASSTYLTQTTASNIYLTSSAANAKYLQLYAEPSYVINQATVTTMARVDKLRANRFAGGLDPASIICETSTDGGTTWVSAGLSDAAKLQLFTHTGSNLTIPLDPKTGKKSTKCMARITITGIKFKDSVRALAETQRFAQMTAANYSATNVYATVSDFYFWLSGNSDRIKITIQHSKGTSPNDWSTIGSCPNASGWSGMNTIHTNQTTFGGYDGQFGNYIFLRFIFQTVASDGSADDSKLSTSSTTSKQSIYNIMGYGPNVYSSANLMGLLDRPYQYYSINSTNAQSDYQWQGNIIPQYTSSYLGSSSYAWNAYLGDAEIKRVIHVYEDTGNSNGTSKSGTTYLKGTREIMWGEVTKNHDIGFAYRNSPKDAWTFSNTVFFRPSYGAWYWGTGPKLNGNFDIGDNSSSGSTYGKLRDIYMTGSLKNKNGTGVTVDNIIAATNRITKYSNLSSYEFDDDANYLLVAKNGGVYIWAEGDGQQYSEKYEGLLLIGTQIDADYNYRLVIGGKEVFYARDTTYYGIRLVTAGTTFDLYQIA